MSTSIFIPELWGEEAFISSGVSESWVKQHVSGEMGKINTSLSGYVKTDGSNKMKGALNLDNNDFNQVKFISGHQSQDISFLNNIDIGLNNLKNIKAIQSSSIDIEGTVDLLNENEIINPKFSQNPNALAPRYVVDSNYKAVEFISTKLNNTIIPVTGQIVTASSGIGDNAFDGGCRTEWVVSNASE